MSPRVPMKNRAVRVSDKDWDAAHARAELLGENLSENIREFIRAYGQQKEEGKKMGKVTTTEELLLLPVGAVLRGPDWHEEVYQKVGDVEFMGTGSDTPWLASNLEQRGPFDVLYNREPK